MRYLLLSSCLLLFAGCTSSYKQLQKIEGNASCLQKFRPQFASTIYTTQVNVVGNYLSGLLVIKSMPDSSIRMVFSSEMGLTFFDFEYDVAGGFKVHYIIKKMNRKAVIKTLKQDFELVLMRHLHNQKATIVKNDHRIYYGFPQKKGSNYYITDLDCSELLGIEKSSRTKAVVTVVMKDYKNGIPDTIGISHANFHFTIGLKRLER
jgi:hypothetical protein